VGALQIQRTNQRLEAVHWLKALGAKAALRWPIRVTMFTDILKPLGKKAIVRRRDVRNSMRACFLSLLFIFLAYVCTIMSSTICSILTLYSSSSY